MQGFGGFFRNFSEFFGNYRNISGYIGRGHTPKQQIKKQHAG